MVACQSFGREIRLLTTAQFGRVLDQPSRVSVSHFTFLAASNQMLSPRLGLAISKKSDKRAVVRNRVKRHIRESFRLNQQQLAGLDIVVISRPGISRLSDVELNLILERSWRKLIRQFAG